MRKMTIRQTDQATWVADSTISTDIELVGVITRIDFTVEVTPSATLTGANQPDGLFRLMQNIRILGGSHTYITLPGDDGAGGGVLHHYLNQRDGFGYGHHSGSVTAPLGAAYIPINWPFHFGSRPQTPNGVDNPFDLSAFIPAHAESQLRAEWVVSGNDVMDDTVTISSALGVFTLHRVLGSDAEMLAEMARQGVMMPAGATGMIPAWSAVTHANAGTTTDFDAETVNIPVGAFLARIGLLIQDATATRPGRSMEEVTEFSINSPTTNERLYQANIDFQASQKNFGSHLTVNSGADESGGTEQMGADFNAQAAVGVYTFDARPRTQTMIGQDYGWDLRGLQTGDLTVGLLISSRAAGDDTLFLFERYAIYEGPLS